MRVPVSELIRIVKLSGGDEFNCSKSVLLILVIFVANGDFKGMSAIKDCSES